MTSDSDKIKRAWDLMESVGVALLVTRRGDGLHGRPMSALVRPGERRIYFLADRRSASDHEIAANPLVYIGFFRRKREIRLGLRPCDPARRPGSDAKTLERRRPGLFSRRPEFA